MKTLLLVLLLNVCLFAKAQIKDSIPESKDTSATYIIRLVDNTELSGKIIDRTNTEIIFSDITIGQINIPVNKIAKIIRLSGDQYCILTTNDGKKFTGQIISRNETELTLKTESLGTLNIPNNKIRDIELIEKTQIVGGKYFFKNPHPTRYFFSPSAIPLEKGEGYYQCAYLLANGVQVGVDDHFSMGGGIVIPMFFFITPKIGYQVGKNVYVGGGILFAAAFTSDVNVGMGIGYASVTLGNKENNITLNGGWGAAKKETYDPLTNSYDYSWGWSDKPTFSLSGAARIAPKLSLITENWLLPFSDTKYDQSTNTEYTVSKYATILSFGFRIMGQRNSFDLALAIPAFDGEAVGIPYIDYVFKF